MGEFAEHEIELGEEQAAGVWGPRRFDFPHTSDRIPEALRDRNSVCVLVVALDSAANHDTQPKRVPACIGTHPRGVGRHLGDRTACLCQARWRRWIDQFKPLGQPPRVVRHVGHRVRCPEVAVQDVAHVETCFVHQGLPVTGRVTRLHQLEQIGQ